MLAKPGSITPHTKFKGEVYILTKEEGGRHTPFFNGYRPQFYIRTTDVTGSLNLPEGVEMVMPGDNTPITVELITPVAMEKGRAVRDPRGRPDGGRGHDHRNHRVGPGRLRRRALRAVPRRRWPLAADQRASEPWRCSATRSASA